MIGKENDINFWSGTVNRKYYYEFDRSIHIIGGLFGGRKENWDWLVTTFEDYLEKILTDSEEGLPMEEQIMTLMWFNYQQKFARKHFDIWWCKDNCPPGTDPELFERNKSFYKILLELNNINE